MRKVVVDIDHRINKVNIRDWDSNEALWSEIFTDEKSVLKFAKANSWTVAVIIETSFQPKKPGLLERAFKFLRGSK